ncbi:MULTISPECIES: hypothetical protein [Paracoccaceae]|uniref:hypothetical protein n=1 Tax=Paracoccaceae TaxID=31989 RepID=UPI003297653C
MPMWMLIVVCAANLAASLGGSVALKHAVTTGKVVWGLAGGGCWLGTAIFMALLFQERPMVWVVLATSSLSLLGSLAVATFLFGEPLSAPHVAAMCFALAALVCTAFSGG